MPNRVRAGKQNREQSTFDYSLLLITLCLIGFGLLMIYSSSSYKAQVDYGDSAYFLKKQIFGVCVGFAAMFIVCKFPYQNYMKNMPFVRMKFLTFIYIVAVVLQTAVMFVGKEVYGAKRWLVVGPISIQPSELTKIAAILVTAYFIYKQPRQIDKFRGMIRLGGAIGLLIGLVAKENLSTAIVISVIMYGMAFIAAKNKKPYWVLLLIGVGIIALVFCFGEGFRAERFNAWLDVEHHDKGYQTLQGLYAIASGGLTGTGLGESMQKLGTIPESHNDMIFSIVCEELGMIGAGMVILMFVFMLWRIYIIAVNAPDLYASMICVGVLFHIATQVVINIAVVTNSMPSTGIPLPFISYGGTSVMILMAEIGLVLGISSQCKRT